MSVSEEHLPFLQSPPSGRPCEDTQACPAPRVSAGPLAVNLCGWSFFFRVDGTR